MTVVSGAVIRLSMPSRLPTPHLMCGLVVGLGVDRIVDAHATVVAPPLTARGMRVLCVGGCCLYRLISTSQLDKPLPVFHSWPINPVIYWEPTRTPKVSCGDLILKMVSRLDAFSGYPSRT